MSVGSHWANAARHVRLAFAVMALLGLVLLAEASLKGREEAVGSGPTVGEKIASLVTERATLQARAGGEARIGLLASYRAAALLTDALAARIVSDSEADRPFDGLPAALREAFDELDALNLALKDAMERPGDGARQAAARTAGHALARLDRLAGVDDAPLVLSFTPLFVAPRRARGELTLAPGISAGAPRNETLRFEPAPPATTPSGPPVVPRYAPEFAVAADEDPPVEVEIDGRHLASEGSSPPVLAVGPWRGAGSVAGDRVRFSVPRAAFPTDATRTTFAIGVLSVRGTWRNATFHLLFTVLPDRPGSFAFDQRIQTTQVEANTLVSPEVLSRAPAGETRTVRRCFDPPDGWRFDKERRRVVIVERLGWQDDVSDPTLNTGSVEFVPEEEPGQICVAAIARPSVRAARTATIGRFEATLLRDVPIERVVKSGIRALDWREASRLAIEPHMTEWKLYIRLFDEIDREFDQATPAEMAFLRIVLDADQHTLVLEADPAATP